MEAPRASATRKRDTLALLETHNLDGWVATGSPYHLVPLSVVWAGERLMIAIDGTSRTARNLAALPTARIGLGTTRDVVMVDAAVEATYPVGEVPAAVGDAYAAQSDWDPRQEGPPYVFVVLAPTRIQAWRESNEIPARTLMRNGRWLE